MSDATTSDADWNAVEAAIKTLCGWYGLSDGQADSVVGYAFGQIGMDIDSHLADNLRRVER